MQEEADDAKSRGVLVPVLIENVLPPIGFRSVQAAHLVDWDGTESTQAFRRLLADIAPLIRPSPNEAGERGKLTETKVERTAGEERKRAESGAKLEAEVPRKAVEQAEPGRKAAKEKKRGRTAAPRGATPDLREQLEHVKGEQAQTATKTKTVPWRIIAGSVIVLGVVAIVAVWLTSQPAPPVTSSREERPQPPFVAQPAPPLASEPARPFTSTLAPPVTSSLEEYEKAAKDNADAMFNLGVRYDDGLGVARDDAKAREWYEKAAAKGNADAMNNLGALYFDGRGVTQDYAKAREWYEKAAAKDNADAMTNLGILFENGRGVTQDYAKAREWYEKAAAKDNANAMTNLGILFENGRGVTRDYAKAREWYEKAAAKGDMGAKRRLEQLPK